MKQEQAAIGLPVGNAAARDEGERPAPPDGAGEQGPRGDAWLDLVIAAAAVDLVLLIGVLRPFAGWDHPDVVMGPQPAAVLLGATRASALRLGATFALAFAASAISMHTIYIWQVYRDWHTAQRTTAAAAFVPPVLAALMLALRGCRRGWGRLRRLRKICSIT